jgi:DNA-binding CsgD family transcriptional regulator
VEAVLLMSKLFELGWGTDNASFRQVFTSQFIPGASADLMRAFDELQRETTTKEDAIRNFETSAQLDVTELAARVSCPTLVLHARDDQRVPFEEGRLFASLIPGARFVPLPGRNHVLLANEPAWPRFVEEIEAFIGAHPEGPFGALSARERELVAHLARGLDNHQIAAHMGLSEKTVRNHLSSILDKLGLESRAQAIVKAREAGFGLG